ncbi:filamentous hemagglutinin N-terminal domain-containing protein [Sulfurospirillum sp. T05]|uniref:Filamentous hemagglutinin N-terminal domain-containing protein n=1 Tax=Sulfurospirillum tamanense TaxID=2813362 RepID=A0ABS2WTN1_9BACT|nr:YDG domain-containing protein [Sulfurospirillum tamanensis]MBN2965005.1 filamentous hemagglutinin N-terminal domain-containing protein [Sulfurospirillum tamanensis]
MKFSLDYSSRFRILKGGKIALVVSAVVASASLLQAAPSGGVVTSGSANITQSGAVTTITQSTQKAAINWTDFSIKANETVNFVQPSANAIALNRVVGNERSVIDGALSANGQVWLLNSNGVLFGKNASINTAGLLATTSSLSDADFNAGNYTFSGASNNAILNLGTITISSEGYAILSGKEVQNQGSIHALRGDVHLVGADTVSINLNGNSLLNLTVNKGVLDALVKNSGSIQADGGEVYLTTNAVDELLKGVVNSTGIIEARSLEDAKGKIVLFAHGGSAHVDGTLDASGGFIETSGKSLHVEDSTIIKTAKWLIDPDNITIESAGGGVGGESVSATAIQNALSTADIELQAVYDITVNENITWATATQLKLTAGDEIYVNAAIENTNTTNGGVYFNAANVRDKVIFNANGKVIIHNVNQLQWMNQALAGKYELGSDIDASVTSGWNVGDHDNNAGTANVAMGFVPIGDNVNRFSGSFNGLGHTIAGLFINRPTTSGVGFFGYINNGATIQNVGVTSIDITGISSVGGLVGYIHSGTINNSYASGNVMGKNPSSYAGGLVGYILSGTINNSYAGGSVRGDGGGIGGLVGGGSATITNSYATGSVTGTDYLGGLMGLTASTVTITNSYATGMVTGNEGASHVGGLMGRKEGGVITNSFWDTQTTGQATSVGGGVGKTTAQMQTLSTFAGWDITGTDGAYPTLTLGGATIWTMSPINLSYSLSTQNHTYNGSIYNLADFWSASSIFGASYASWVLGTDYTFIYDSSSTTGFKNAGTYSNITIDILKSGYTEAGIGNTAGALTIAQKALTISGITASNKTYDGLLTATVNTASVAKTGLIDGDTLTVSSSGVFTDKNAGTGKTVTLTNTYAGADKDNYIITDQTTATADIAQKALTISGISASNKTYDGLLTATVNTASVIKTGLIDGDTLTVSSSGVFTDKNAGTGKTVTLTNTYGGADVNNYAITDQTTTTADIAQKALTISGISASNKTYDGLLTATVNTASVIKTGLIDGDTLTVSSSGVFTDKNAGTGKTVTLTNTYAGADKDNYIITDQTTATADIAQKALTISGLVADNKIYDGTTSVVMTNWGSLSGLVGTETLTLGHGTASFENAEVGNSKTVTAIDYTLSDGDNGGVVGNYLLALNTATTTANITSATPTPQPNPQPTPPTPDVSHIENGTASLVSTAFVQQMQQSPQAFAPVVAASGPLPFWGNGNIAIINGGVRLPDYVDQEETR